MQLVLREQPTGRVVMRQSWRDLLFLHFPCDPAEIVPLIPKGLTLDTFPDETGEEKAWIGLVPFLMTNVRWAFAPRVPGTHTFPETNVRTYVHREGKEPGVWFFSLDAMNRLAVRTARAAFALPYYHATMTLTKDGDEIDYRGEREGARYDIRARIGEPLPEPSPGSLEFFLIERYLLYAYRFGKLYSGRVDHPPYRLRQAQILHIEESLVAASSITPTSFLQAHFSEGVDVDVYPLRPFPRRP